MHNDNNIDDNLVITRACFFFKTDKLIKKDNFLFTEHSQCRYSKVRKRRKRKKIYNHLGRKLKRLSKHLCWKIEETTLVITCAVGDMKDLNILLDEMFRMENK